MINSAKTIEESLPKHLGATLARARARVLVSNNVLAAVGLFACVLVLGIPYFGVPHFWDSLQIAAGADRILHNGLNPILPAVWDPVGHPVLFHETLAVTWLVLGHSLWSAHLLIAVFAFLAVYFTFLVGQQLFGTQVGLIASVLLLFYPLFRAQSTVVLLDLPAAAFAIMAVYFLLKRNTGLYLLAACAMVLTKETTVLLIPSILLYLFLTMRKEETFKRLLPTLAIYSLPVFVLGGWFALHVLASGWLVPQYAPLSPQHIVSAFLPPALFTREGILYQFVHLAAVYFGRMSMIGLLTLVVLAYAFSVRPLKEMFGRNFSWASIIASVRKQPMWQAWGSPAVLALLALPIFIHLTFIASSFILQRYLMPEYILFFILAARAVQGVFKQQRFVLAATAVMLVIFAIGWVTPWFGNEPESPSNLSYTNFTGIHRAAAAFIESKYPGKTVLAGWPQYIELTLPLEGYVTRPQKVLAYADSVRYSDRITTLGGTPFYDENAIKADDFDVVYYSNAANAPKIPDVMAIVRRFNMVQVAEFKQGSDYVAIYARPQGQ